MPAEIPFSDDGTPVAAPTARVFFALWPTPAIATQLHQLARDAAASDARIMRVDTLHLTLAFIGDVAVDRLPAIEAVGDQTVWPRCTFHLDQLGHWPHNQILWAGSQSPPDALANLASELSSGLQTIGIRLAARPFVSHVTLARRCRHAQGKAFVPIEWAVEGGVLAVSHRDASGARYEIRRRWLAA
ncbi:RNA 2',3'-cyclic phosphodiesterase [Denitromonas halophila]|uniref:RNA 2',3'-cyclic phosphodiesterase n=1 Tax=Denitromonas halophila TaxID=1629404 RepID=A0A557QK15_9RHOO|nr:RNA 2',3'-cyclic phosphodiesterase [Denitromonas halophila]TVO53252.1 RNA 2',3'-cyclic phosphodiesterase [Denitromonas halophila]